MEPIRILQVVTIMNRGGLETMLMNYYRQIDRARIQFDFMVHRSEEGHYDQEIKELGGKIYKMPQIRPGNYRRYFKELDVFFKKHDEYKVVHSHINENSSFVLRAAKKVGIPGRIAHSHLSDLGLDKKLPFRLYARYHMKDNPTSYFACSKNAGQWLFGRQIMNSNLSVVNNAVNVEEFKHSKEIRAKVRRELGLKNQLVIGHVGRFNKQKNHEFIIDIFKELKNKKPDAVLVLIGEGNLMDDIRVKVKKHNLTENVKFLGVRNDIPDLMQAMDLFLFPSLFEGLPVVLVEAQAAGLRCVVSNSITNESDVTGRVHFMSLQDSSAKWADQILLTPLDRIDSTEDLIRNGYDSRTMVKWLSKYYSKYYLLAN
ncbi:glycosyltransferase family 1 protein [Litchfieldia salsa]|uniref:Glycosyltransferase involved in cell wall bisynthesis n=1 Tax=Litchfieldia salsa TaxID=930152 RepID=A0A1H0VDU8_9BACI|nr:glycosyltransferase family 1 protein [Litchfieldia salsa]SDP76702.1 Glycosyltransferase involved in cell wall bisynthesis [Litchfieldia salsa]